MEFGLLVKNVIIIGIIGAVVVASQSAYFRPMIKSVYAPGVKSDNSSYITKANDWVKTTIYPRLDEASGEVAKTQASLQEGIVEQKNKVVEDSTNATKKIIAQKFLDFLGISAAELGACPAN